MLEKLGTLKWTFVAASGALVVIGAALGPFIFENAPEDEWHVLWGALLGLVAAVPLYAIMRAKLEGENRKAKAER